MWLDDYTDQISHNIELDKKTAEAINGEPIDWDAPLTERDMLCSYLNKVATSGISRQDVQLLKALETTGYLFRGIDENNYTATATFSGITYIRTIITNALNICE